MDVVISIITFFGFLSLIFAMKTVSVEWFVFYAILSASCLTFSYIYLVI